MKEISTTNAPGAIGPNSQGVETGGLVFVSGQIPVSPKDGTIPEGIKAQTEQSLENVKVVLEEAGSGLGHVLKTTVFLKNMDDFADMNEVYAKYFSMPYPARAAVQVAKLPKDVLVEIEAVAEKA